MDMGKPGISAMISLTLFSILLVSAPAQARTECRTEGCKITITIKIAFAGATDQQIRGWSSDIEDVWNGPQGFQTTGDCDCEVRFEVETMKITNASQVNCDPPPAGYHCVMVTPWDGTTQSLPFFYNSSGDKVHVNGYMGYKTQSPSQGGASLDGWWSDQMNRPAPGGGIYHDAAHEAGHMMGLDDGEGDGLMTHTSGDKARPTQANIDSAVRNVCGAGACPDECCCGNGQVDRGKGEQCDPFAEPVGCSSGEACCPSCCSCFAPQCSPAAGEHVTKDQCEIYCRTGFGCYYNYETGCWDCLRQAAVVEGPPYDPGQAREAGELFHASHAGGDGDLGQEPLVTDAQLEMVRQLYNDNIAAVPQVRDLLGNERVNFHIEGAGIVGMVNQDGEMVSIQAGELQDPTLNMRSDMGTLEGIVYGDVDPLDALKDGRITYEGVGLVNWLRFAFAGLMLSLGSALGLV